MKKIVSKDKNPYVIGYIFCTIVCLLILFIQILLSHGDLINHYFFYDTADTGMDFFHSIEYVNERAPYDLFNTLYPPLANLLFYVFLYLVPVEITRKWPLDFSKSVSMRRTENDLRVYQAPMLLFIFFILICTLFIIFIVSNFLEKNDIKNKNCILTCLFFSYGMLMTIERGNILMLALPLTMFFVFNYESDKKIVREISYISLAIAAGLKLYPAFFGILLLRKKDWWAACRTVLYGVFSIILPALFFKEGFGAIAKWLKVVLNFNKDSSQPWVGNSFNNFLHHVQHFFGINGVEISDKCFNIASLLIVAVLLAISLFEKKWKSVFLVTLAMCFFQTQGEYIYSFFAIPLICLFVEETEICLADIIPYLSIIVFMVPLPVFYEADEFYPRNIIIHFVYMILLVWGIIQGIIYMKRVRRIDD